MCLIVPFVSIYTKGINDANYIQPMFSILIVIAELIYCFREPSTALIYAAGHFKRTAKFAYAEAGSNIVISLLLVRKLGLTGVAVGTLLGMLLRWILHVLYLRKNIIFVSGMQTLKFGTIFFIDILILLGICKSFVPNIMYSYFEWVKYGILVTVVSVIVTSLTNYLFNKKSFTKILKMLFKKSL